MSPQQTVDVGQPPYTGQGVLAHAGLGQQPMAGMEQPQTVGLIFPPNAGTRRQQAETSEDSRHAAMDHE